MRPAHPARAAITVRRRAQPAPVRMLTALALSAAVVNVTGCGASHHAAHPAPPDAASAPGTAHGTIGDLAVSGGYIPQPASPSVAAAYFTVTNRGPVPDALIKVTSSVTRQVTAMRETDAGGVGTMTDLTALTVPAHGSTRLTAGHAHLMLDDPSRPLRAGDRITMTITFRRAGTLALTLPVVPVTGPTPNRLADPAPSPCLGCPQSVTCRRGPALFTLDNQGK